MSAADDRAAELLAMTSGMPLENMRELLERGGGTRGDAEALWRAQVGRKLDEIHARLGELERRHDSIESGIRAARGKPL